MKNKIRFSTTRGSHFVMTKNLQWRQYCFPVPHSFDPGGHPGEVLCWFCADVIPSAVSGLAGSQNLLRYRLGHKEEKMVDIFNDEQTFYFAFFTFTMATIIMAFILSRFITLNPSYHV